VLSVEDWAEIRRLHRAEGVADQVDRQDVGDLEEHGAFRDRVGGPPRYERKPVGSAVDAFEQAIREQLLVVPTMPATVIAQRVGWTRGMTVFKERVRELRPAYLPPDPTGRTAYVAGEIAQCDLWFPPIGLPVGFGQVRKPTQLPVLTMVTGYSRWLSAILIPTRRAEDLFSGWWRLIQALGAVPRTLVWDGEGAIGRWRGGKTELTQDCQAFRGVLGTKVLVVEARPAGAQGHHRTDPRLPGAVVPARPGLHRPGRLQCPAAGVAEPGQRKTAPGVGVRPDRPDRRRPPGHAGLAPGGSSDRLAVGHPARP